MNDVDASDVPWGADSEYGQLLDVLLCPPDNFRWLPTSAISRRRSRRAELRLRARDAPARRDGLRLRGRRRPLHFLEPDPALPYQVFARDSSFDDAVRAVVTQLHQRWRRGEYAPVIRFYQEAGIPIRRMITAAAFEGGDVIIIEPGQLLIGNGEERTEDQAAASSPPGSRTGWEVRIEPIPSHSSTSTCSLAILAPKLAAVCVDVAGAGLVRWLRAPGSRSSRSRSPSLRARRQRDLARRRRALSSGARRASTSSCGPAARGLRPGPEMFTLGGGGAHCLAQALRRERVA